MASERETVQKFIVEVSIVCRQLNVECIWCYANFDLGCPDNVRYYQIAFLNFQGVESYRCFRALVCRLCINRSVSGCIINQADWILEIDAGYSHRSVDII